jgi:cell division septation protein DedD
MEVGLRHDWGDAETGFGLELGGRVQYADPALGLTIEAAVRGLLAHEDRDYQEWGASGTVRLAPGPGGRGLSLTLAPTWGAASSGVDGLWSRQTTAGLAPSGRPPAQAGRLNAQVGYGLWLPSTGGLVTPFTGVSVADGDGWRTRAGLLFVRPDTWGGGLRLELAGESSTTAVGQAEQTIGLQLQFTFGRGSRGPQVGKGSRGFQGHNGRGSKARATLGQSPTAPDGVVTGPRTPTSTRADHGPRRAAVRPPATAQPAARLQKTPPASALARSDGPRYFVQLGAFSDHADAIKARTELAGDLRGLLLRHHRRLAVVRSKGHGLARVVFVQAFRTPDAAAALCAAIKARGPACSITAAWPKPDKASRGLHVAKIRGGG